MNKIMVIGVSAGAGKSTFARELGVRTGLPVHHLDAHFWNAGWVESTPEEFIEKTAILLREKEWIIDGNYSATFEMRAAEADTMIYLELPLRVCLYRVLKRWVSNLGHTRPDMPESCEEKMDKEFLSFIIRTYATRKVKMRHRLQQFEEARPGNRSIILRGKRQIEGFLDTFPVMKGGFSE
ncbi:P-loop NTPase family protein [Planococcus lenghuensis]|uniref:Topology modulation protein n=1 Tax=Planococcus lenghuensis TaxID=2213202 RepID=A0A1Q2KUY2_9BACL|nr:topology modulation protein [Planococcus lenghuensis]AQQ52025.1 topology modulation protein [Planococcus lenghuensis]